jgi:RNA polymerase sigma factor (sigma-70 family)
MPSGRESLVCYIRRLAALPPAEEASDTMLLGRFVAERDEQAFAALVKRHGAMVHQVCWRILGDFSHAEDAFQATFLVLARKAVTVQPGEVLPAWLHSVARRVALKARSARFRRHESGPLPEATADGRPDPLAEISARELLSIIDEEIQRLPERYRLPVILCCLEGRSLEEASRQLGWTIGSVKGRLERGRARLHDRLVRRGLTLAAALASVEVSRALAPASVIAGLAARTVPGALAYGAGEATATAVSQSAILWASRVVMDMAFPRLAITAELVLTLAAVGAGIAIPGKPPEPTPPAQNLLTRADVAAAQRLIQQEAPPPFWDQSDVPIDVQGQVLDPRGKPVAGAELYVGYSMRRFVLRALPERAPAEQSGPSTLSRRATTDADGRFHFRFATSELDPSALNDALPAVMAVAPGYGPEWAEIGPSGASGLKLQLVDDLPASGRVLDSKQAPVAGAKLVVRAIYKSTSAGELDRFVKGDVRGSALRCWKGPLPGKAPTITTDAAGTWRCAGLGQGRIADFALEGPGVPLTFPKVVTRPGEVTSRNPHLHGSSFDYLTPPVRTIRGEVRDQATLEPIAGVSVTIKPGNAKVYTGLDGRFEILEHAQKVGYGLIAQPEPGQGYFAGQACAREQDGALELTQDIFLVRGITLSGKVTNDSTGKPPRSALVEYYPLSSNPHSGRVSCTNMIPASTAPVRADGSYSLVVLPGPGVLCVAAAPHEDYAAADITSREWLVFLRQQRALFLHHEFLEPDPVVAIALGAGHPGALRINKYHAVARINPPEEARSHMLDLPLVTAQTLQGTVLAPDGQPLSGVEVVGLTALSDEREWLEGASFTVTGLHPQGSRRLFLQHRDKKLGKLVTVHGNAAQPVRIELEPCGAATGRLVDNRGNPLPGVFVTLNASPGYTPAQTDSLGRFHMALLVPGQRYTWGFQPTLLNEIGTVQVGAGQVLDLGDLVKKEVTWPPKIPQPAPTAPR